MKKEKSYRRLDLRHVLSRPHKPTRLDCSTHPAPVNYFLFFIFFYFFPPTPMMRDDAYALPFSVNPPTSPLPPPLRR